jgi:hypothetical protein
VRLPPKAGQRIHQFRIDVSASGDDDVVHQFEGTIDGGFAAVDQKPELMCIDCDPTLEVADPADAASLPVVLVAALRPLSDFFEIHREAVAAKSALMILTASEKIDLENLVLGLV